MRRRVQATWLAVAAVVAGCAPTAPPTASLEEARTAVREAGADPAVTRYALPELEAAQDAFANAERGVRRQLDPQVVAHWGYLARQRAAIARETARLRKAEDDIATARTAAPNAAASPPSAASGAVDTFAGTGRVVLTLGDDQFELERSEFKPEAAAALDRIARLLEENPSRWARVDGHSDDRGTRSYSVVFAGRRADAVRAELIRRGIDARRIQVRALGESYPVASNETELGRQRNRRVEVYVLDGAANAAPEQ